MTFTLTPGPALAKILAREQAVLHLRRIVEAGVAREAAIVRASRAFRFSASPSALRRWERAYEAFGFLGLVEHKAGAVGRKPSRNRRATQAKGIK